MKTIILLLGILCCNITHATHIAPMHGLLSTTTYNQIVFYTECSVLSAALKTTYPTIFPFATKEQIDEIASTSRTYVEFAQLLAKNNGMPLVEVSSIVQNQALHHALLVSDNFEKWIDNSDKQLALCHNTYIQNIVAE